MKLIVWLDGLYAHGNLIQLLRAHNWDDIIVARPKKLAKLFERLDHSPEVEQYEIIDWQHTRHQFRHLTQISLNDTHHHLKVNLIEYQEIAQNGKVRYSHCWITELKVSRFTLERLMCAGRAHWKVENETFNTLKNQGYYLEPNYGHGYEHLTIV